MTIGAHSTLTSCHIEENVVIGPRCVVMEGARIEKGAMLAAGTVVPPGRLIPENTLWAGNPCEYVKDLDIGELWANYAKSYVWTGIGEETKAEFSLWPNSYLDYEANQEDVYPASFKNQRNVEILHKGKLKRFSTGF